METSNSSNNSIYEAKKCICFDIDGTIADCKHRQHWVQGKHKNWPAFNAAMCDDQPNADIMWLMHILAQQPDVHVVIASGRGEEDRDRTVAWLRSFGIVCEGDSGYAGSVYAFYQKLYMRKAKDNRKDSIVKREILDQIRDEFGEPFMVFDDRNQVVDMWRSEGIRCLQVAPGDF